MGDPRVFGEMVLMDLRSATGREMRSREDTYQH